MGQWQGRAVGVVVAALVGGVLAPAAARAAEYHVYGCHTPSGDVAPTDGWTPVTSGSGAATYDGCGGRLTYALSASLDAPVAHAANASAAAWGFSTAQDLTLAGATLYRYEGLAGGVGPNSTYSTFFAGPNLAYDAADIFDICEADLGCAARGTNNGGLDPANRLVIPAANIGGGGHLYFEVFCGGLGGAVCPAAPDAAYAAEVDLYEADMTLVDGIAPRAENVAGTLVSGRPLTGSTDITFAAVDRGSGVYSAGVTVDGAAASSQVVDSNGGHCETVGQATDGLRDFRLQQPCRSSATVDLTLDTARLHDGTHNVAVTVDDAAGNATGVYGGTITTRNAPEGGVPQITGPLAHGQKLTAAPGTWTPAPTGFGYQWLRCSAATSCQAIPGALGQNYVPGYADDYQQLAVDVTAIDFAGQSTRRSAVVGPIADLSGSAAGGGVQAQSGGLTGAKPPKGSGAAGAGHTPNGNGGCANAHLTATFGSSPVGRVRLGGRATLHGRLDCAGRPVAGASLDASIVRLGGGGTPAAATPRTGADGSFALALGPGPSRAVTLSYLAFADATAPAATVQARLDVTPSISLTIAPARVHNGQTIVYRGQVFGGYIPATGLPLQVEYRDGRRWRTFDSTRARPKDGRFVYHYTFRRTTIPIVYTFRVMIPAGGVTGYPYASAASRPRSVRVNP